MDGPAVVLDCGSGTCRAGFAGESTPRTEFPTVVGRPKLEAGAASSSDVHVGPEVMAKGRSLLCLRYPIEYGDVTNWDDMEKIWHFTFNNALGVSLSGHPVLLTEQALTPKFNREKTTQVMFETFECCALYVAKRQVLSLLSTGRSTGLVISSGGRSSQVVPVYEGHSLPYAMFKWISSGEDLTYYLMKLLGDRVDTSQWTRALHESMDLAKQNLCYVSLDYDASVTSKRWTETIHKLPDGTVVTLGQERFQCPEALFQPQLADCYCWGIQEIAHHTVQKCDKDIRDVLYRNVVLSGGTMMFPGLVARLQGELSKLVPGQAVNVIAASPNSAWNGGSLFASSSTFRQSCITKEEYDEYGPSLVHKKCF